MPIANEHALTVVDILIRMCLSILCGALIGMERVQKRRPAGLRTHMLICLGASMTTLTSQYLLLNLGLHTDPARLGAQVIAGIGFIGAGTIIITKRRQVKGLTTAAGLWTAAVVGLCAGAGFYEGVVVTTVVVIIAELIFSKIEYFVFAHARAFNMYVEYTEGGNLGKIVDTIKKKGGFIMDLEITKSAAETKNPCAVFSVQTPRKISHQELMSVISRLDGIVLVEEL